MGPIGGNWKEFWLSASDPGGGDLDLIEFHLRDGVDPNYQHPEMESTALCEAVRAGNDRVVEYLLKYHLNERGEPMEGVVVVDPTIPSAYENQTPLEIAMEIKHHVMVDLILEALPHDTHAKESRYTRRTLVTIPKERLQYVTSIMKQVLGLGHRMVFTMEPRKRTSLEKDDSSLLRARFARETGNVKSWSVSSVNEVPSFLTQASSSASRAIPTKIDTWLCFPGGTERNASILSMIKTEFVEPYSILSKDARSVPDRAWLMIPSMCLATQQDKQQLVWFLQRYQSQEKVSAMIMPCSWWRGLWRGWSPYWIEEEVLSRLLEMDGSEEHGVIYNYNLEPLAWSNSLPGPDSTTMDQWEELLSES